MTRLEKRLSDLEKAAAPRRRRVMAVLNHGKYTINGKELTPAEFAEIESTCDVTLLEVVYVSPKGNERD